MAGARIPLGPQITPDVPDTLTNGLEVQDTMVGFGT